MPESEGYLDSEDYLMLKFDLTKVASDVMLLALDYRSSVNESGEIVSCEGLLAYLTDPTPQGAALPLREVEVGIEELQGRNLVIIDPLGWATCLGRSEDGRPLRVEGPRAFIGTWKQFHEVPRSHHFEASIDDEERITLGNRSYKFVGAYVEDWREPPEDAVFSFSPSVEFLVDPKFPVDCMDWKEQSRPGVLRDDVTDLTVELLYGRLHEFQLVQPDINLLKPKSP